MRRQALAVLIAVILGSSAAPSFADTRVALVIGNGAYQHAPRLTNPANDAADVTTALKRSGFETILATDLDKAAMDEVTIRFARAARAADVALFYYSGHALQFGGGKARAGQQHRKCGDQPGGDCQGDRQKRAWTPTGETDHAGDHARERQPVERRGGRGRKNQCKRSPSAPGGPRGQPTRSRASGNLAVPASLRGREKLAIEARKTRAGT